MEMQMGKFLTRGVVDWQTLDEFVQSKVERKSGFYQLDPRDYFPDFLPPLHLLDPPIGLDKERCPHVLRFLPVLLEQAQIAHQRAVHRYYMTRNLCSSDTMDPFLLPQGTRTYSAFDDEGRPNPLFQLRNWYDLEVLHYTRYSSRISKNGSSIIHSKRRFQENLLRFAGMDLNGFLSPNIFLTGSAVFLCLTEENANYNQVAPNADVNVFIAAPTLREGERMHKQWLQRFIEHLWEEDIDFRILKGCFSVTIVFGSPIRNIQVSTLIVRDREEMLSLTPVDSASLLYDGFQVICSDRGLRAINTRRNRVEDIPSEKHFAKKYRRFHIDHGLLPRAFETQDEIQIVDGTDFSDPIQPNNQKNREAPPLEFVEFDWTAYEPNFDPSDEDFSDIDWAAIQLAESIEGDANEENEENGESSQEDIEDDDEEDEIVNEENEESFQGDSEDDDQERENMEEQSEEELEDSESGNENADADESISQSLHMQMNLLITKFNLLSARPWKSVIYRPTIHLRDILNSFSKEEKVKKIKAKWFRSCIWKQPFLRCRLCYKHAEHFGEVTRLLCQDCLPFCGERNCLCCKTHLDTSSRTFAKVLIVGSLLEAQLPFAFGALRSGCEVHLATKYPQSLEKTILEEEDHRRWMHKVAILGLDLLDDESLDQFLSYLGRPTSQYDQVIYSVSMVQQSEQLTINPNRRLLLKQFGAAPFQNQSHCSPLMQLKTLALTVPTIIAGELNRLSKRLSQRARFPLHIVFPSVLSDQETDLVLRNCHAQLSALTCSFRFLHLRLSNLLLEAHLKLKLSKGNTRDNAGVDDLIPHFTELSVSESEIDVDELISLFDNAKMPKIETYRY